MTNLCDDRIKQLLIEAESRLAGVSQPATPRDDSAALSQRRPGEEASTPLVSTGQQSSQKLTVREASLKTTNTSHDDAGPNWFGLPKTDPNDKDLRRDMQLLQMRGTALDPKRHYKKGSMKARVPRYAQVGRIIEGPTDFFSARLTRKERKRTLVDELIASEKASGKFKAKYDAIQVKKTSGKKAFYKNLVSQRRSRKNY